MISVKQALNKIITNKTFTNIINIDLINSLNYYLAENIYSPIDMPPFSQSAMDGYAICGEGEMFTVIGEIKAGDSHSFTLDSGQAYRIFTGAMIPKGTTAIAKQEIVKIMGNTIQLTENVKPNTSIREKGEELKKNQMVLSKGSELTPATIGLLSGLGVSEVKVFQKPKVALIVTGNELTKVGQKLLPGKIYESNSFSIKSALLSSGINCSVHFVKDNFEDTKTTIEHAIINNNVVIITGGISVGDYDFVGKSLSDLGVEQMFYKVKQKPGKPLFYGVKNNTKVFGLPGNPAAALTSYYVYILTAIKTMMGSTHPSLLNITATLEQDYTKKGDRAHFLKAHLKGNQVTIHQGQSSAMLSSFASANSFVYLDENTNFIQKGSKVEVLMLP
ncbi:MAG TPA: molybdopterin molybdenumtransferase MoeA [Crocinitomix sp.]|nr:molybdopterin molybdenumtransferase MoeA [Crocinitomix sp.]